MPQHPPRPELAILQTAADSTDELLARTQCDAGVWSTLLCPCYQNPIRVMPKRFPILAAAMPAVALFASIWRQPPEALALETVRLHVNLPNLSHDEILASASHAVLARVVDVTPTEFRPGWVSRRVTLHIEDCWRGQAKQSESLIVHGGRLGNKVTFDSSAPELIPGERYVLYAQAYPGAGEWILAAGSQACAKVERDGAYDVVEMHGESLPVAGLRMRDREALVRMKPVQQGGGR